MYYENVEAHDQNENDYVDLEAGQPNEFNEENVNGENLPRKVVDRLLR